MRPHPSSSSPRVTVGMPVYNGERYVDIAIQSIQAQTFEEFELVISDNASTDRTEEICRRYADTDSRIRYVRHDANGGAAGNFNHALRLATAPYFRWACDDDVLLPTNLERCVAVLDAEPETVLVAPRTTVIDAVGDTVADQSWLRRLDLRSPRPSRRLAAFLKAYRWLGCSSQLFGVARTDVLREVGGLGDYPSSDYVLLAEMALHGAVREVDEILFKKRIHEGSSVEENDWDVDRMAEWLNPDNKGTVQWLEVRWLWEFIRAIHRSPVRGREKLACYRQLMREYATPHAKKIMKEVLLLTARTASFGRLPMTQKTHGFNTMYRFKG